MKKRTQQIALILSLAAALLCASGCGSTRTENGVTIESKGRDFIPWF
jgi:hypothetical protein